MRCPFCAQDKDKVIDSRSSEQGKVIRRRRECLACGRRFTTYERVEGPVKLMVVKKDGSRVPYDRQKLVDGLEKACYKRPVPAERVQQIVERIEDELFKTYDREVESEEIGRLASERLRQEDQVAYVRFASVYKQFGTIDELFEEVQQVIASRTNIDTTDQGKLF
ncbi:MAG: transcriptional regulator NrdR [Phycisphaeraceae bacterium]